MLKLSYFCYGIGKILEFLAGKVWPRVSFHGLSFFGHKFFGDREKKACLKSQGWLRDPLPSVWWWCWGRRQACPRGKRRKRSWDRGGGKRTKWCPWRQCGPRLSTAWQSQRLKAKKGHFAHCSNPEVRIRKKMQPKFEAAVRTPMKRASKWAPTWYSWPLASKSLWP